MNNKRKTHNIGDTFYNDGHWYTLTSASLGGMSPSELSEALRGGSRQRIHQLMADGVCLPLAFNSDGVLDMRTRFVVGELLDEEKEEWIVCLRAPLNIPDGQFVVVAGAMPEHFEAIGSDRTDGYVTVDVEPGRYTLEVYGYIGSETVNALFYQEEDEEAETCAEAPSTQYLQAWWKRTRGDAPEPAWMELWAEEGDVDGEEAELLEYVIRLVKSDEEVEVPPQDEDYVWWVSAFQSREPAQCPRGIPFDTP